MSSTRRCWRFTKRLSTTSEDQWEQFTEELAPLQDGQVLLHTVLVSTDPYLRIQQSRQKTWQQPYKENEIQLSYALARVVETKSDLFAVGDYVSSYVGWCDKAIVNAKGIQKLAYKKGDDVPLEAYLGPLG
jgi:NADPH-dependent curcumin reductase CurA